MSLPSSRDRERILTGIQGLEEIKSASLYLTIVWLIGFIILIIFYVYIATLIPLSVFMWGHRGFEPGPRTPPSGLPPALGALMVLIVILAIAGLAITILGLYAVYGKLVPGISKLAVYSSEYSTASSLVKIGFVGGLVLVLIAIALMFLVAITRAIILVVLILALIALILFLLGRIGLVIACFKLNDEFSEGTLLAAGIVFIISIFISIDFIGWILLYAGLSSPINKLKKRLESPESIPPTGEVGGEAPIL